MRRGHGSIKVPNVKLRPPPVTSSTVLGSPQADDMYDSGEQTPLTHADLSLASRPFSKVVLCSTGIRDKVMLFKQAAALGARCQNDLTSDVTHLVATEAKGAKYECAVENRMAVMSPDWITQCYAAWIEGQDVNFESSIERFRLQFLSGSIISVTGDIDISSRREIHSLVERYGGVYSSNLTKACTHLLVCGTSYDTVCSTEKVKFALRANREGKARIYILWVEWFWDCISFLGSVAESKYRIEQPRPVPLFCNLSTDAKTKESSANARDPCSSLRVVSMDTRSDEPEPAVVATRINSAVGAQNALLWKYIKGKNLSESEKPFSHIPAEATQEDTAMTECPAGQSHSTANAQEPQRTGSHNGASVIARLATSRNASTPSAASISHLNPLNAHPSLAGPQVHLDERAPSQRKRGLFEGKTFCLIGDAQGPVLEGAIRSSGGKVLSAEALHEPQEAQSINLEIDWVIVRLVTGNRNLPPADSSLAHLLPKYVTECWVEECLHQDRVCSIDEHASFRPIVFETPLPELQDFRIHLSGLEDGDLLYTQRLVRTLGAQVAVIFSRRSTTHLVCKPGNSAKYTHARRWNVPVVTPAWIYDMARIGLVPEVSDYPFEVALDSAGSPQGLQTRSPPLSEAWQPVQSRRPVAAVSVHAMSPGDGIYDARRQRHSVAAGATPQNPGFQQTSPARGTRSLPGVSSATSPMKHLVNQAASDALSDLAVLLLPKRANEESEEEAPAPKKRRRPVARVKSGERSSGATSYAIGSPPSAQVFDIPGRLADGVEHEPLTETAMATSAEESMRVMYEDPEQRAEKRKLLRMIGAIPESFESTEAEGAASTTVHANTRTSVKRSTRYS